MRSKCAFGCGGIVDLKFRGQSAALVTFLPALSLYLIPFPPDSVLLTAASAQGVRLVVAFTK